MLIRHLTKVQLLVVAVLIGSAGELYAYTPESPKVQAAVAKASKFLISENNHNRVGGTALVGLALYKSGTDANHPKIRQAVKRCDEYGRNLPKYSGAMMYDVGLALVFLCEVNPEDHRIAINQLIQFLVQHQKPDGGFGYQGRKTGDNSMTQYAALGLWIASKKNFNVPMETIARLCNWIIAVQDPSGAFGYQGNVSYGDKRKKQSEIRLSLSAAGMCSLYVSVDALGLGKRGNETISDLPEDFLTVTADGDITSKSNAVDLVDSIMLKRCRVDGDRYMRKNFKVNSGAWQLYYLYALERYKAFYELELGRPDPDQRWYDEGVDFLDGKQSENGSIRGSSEDAIAGTAFAVLFLIRGTRKSIEDTATAFDSGLLRGGRGLPKSVAEAKVKDGNLVDANEIPETERFLEMLESDDGSLDRLVETGVGIDLNLTPEEKQNALIVIRRKLLRGDYAARMAALRAIRKEGDFESVPHLIYALSDPDLRIALEARDTLRILSRKFKGFGMPDNPSEADRFQAIGEWKKWYQSLKPNAIFFN